MGQDFRRVSRTRGFGLMLALVVAACSSPNKAKTTNKDPHTEPPSKLGTPPESGLAKIPSLQKACQTLMEVSAGAIEIHLVSKKDEATFDHMMNQGLELLLASESFTDEEAAAWAKKYTESERAACKPYFDLAEIKYKSAVLRAQKNEGDSLKEHIGLNILRKALWANLHSLDPFSGYAYITQDEYKKTQEVYGPGLILYNRTDLIEGRKPKYFVIRDVIESSPNYAQRANLLYRRITHISFVNAAGETVKKPASFYSLDEINELLNVPVDDLTKDNKKSSWTLTLHDHLGAGPYEVKVRNGTYVPSAAYSMQLDSKTAYIKLLTFMKTGSAKDFKRALRKIAPTSTSLIFDLRGNGGGNNAEMEEIAELFLPRGSIYGYEEYATDKRLSDDEKKISFKGSQNGLSTVVVKDVLKTADSEFESIYIPENVFLLLDRHSASNSEKLAGAFKDYGISINLGEVPYGKGIGQSVFPVPAPIAGYMQVTSQYFYSPSGKSNHLDASALIDVLIKDPILEKASSVLSVYGDRRFQTNMSSRLEIDGKPVIPAPRPLSVEFTPRPAPELPHVYISPTRTCPNPVYPEDPHFIEEEDCILSIARQLADAQN